MDSLRVYGSEVSYFTGKFEAYLRYKGIPYERIGAPPLPATADRREKPQMPMVELADGRRMTDTTPMIAWLETQVPEPPVIPTDPLQAFFSRLLEDYADEWLWRPAMHYRWDYAGDRALLRRKLVDELVAGMPLPAVCKRFMISTRQQWLFTRGDGVTRETWDHVEAAYFASLRQLEAIVATRPFLLGDRPTLADFGFMASMFRHFGMDPTPSTIMRESAPGVYAWVARVWDARASRLAGAALVDGVPDDWHPILDSIGACYLPHLCANAEAWKAGRRRFSVALEGVQYTRVRTSRYRVWCLEELRRHYEALGEADARSARALLEEHGCWEPLWRVTDLASGINEDQRAPFGPGYSMTGLGDRRA